MVPGPSFSSAVPAKCPRCPQLQCIKKRAMSRLDWVPILALGALPRGLSTSPSGLLLLISAVNTVDATVPIPHAPGSLPVCQSVTNNVLCSVNLDGASEASMGHHHLCNIRAGASPPLPSMSLFSFVAAALKEAEQKGIQPPHGHSTTASSLSPRPSATSHQPSTWALQSQAFLTSFLADQA